MTTVKEEAQNSSHQHGWAMNDSDLATKYHSDIGDAERYTEVTLLSVISVVSVIANSSLWMAILGTKALRRESSLLLLLCLSLADLLVSVVCMPVTVFTIAMARWVFSAETCSVLGFFTMVTLVSSVMSLGLISINRYIKICRPAAYHRLYTRINILFMAFGVWCLSALLASPPLLGWCRYDYLPRQSFCFSDWPTSVSYTFFMIIVCFGGPLSMMSVCNVRILLTFRRSQKHLQFPKAPSKVVSTETSSGNVTRSGASLLETSLTGPTTSSPADSPSLPPHPPDSSRPAPLRPTSLPLHDGSICSPTTRARDVGVQSLTLPVPEPAESTESGGRSPNVNDSTTLFLRQQRKERRRAEEFQLAVSLMVVVVVFVLCWFPFCVSMFLSVFAPQHLPRAADMFTLLLGYSNSCINPVIYGAMNKRVKEAYKSLWAKMFPCCVARAAPLAISDTVTQCSY